MVSGAAIRLMASTGLLAAGVVLGGLCAGTALADSDESAGESKAAAEPAVADATGGSVTSRSASSASNTINAIGSDGPAGSIGAGDDKSSLVPTGSSSRWGGRSLDDTMDKFVRSLLPPDTVKIPLLRIPGTVFNTADDKPCARGAVACFSTIDVPIYNVEKALKVLLDPYGEPEPEPDRPGIRGPVVQSPQIEEPVIDFASPGSDTGSAGDSSPQPIVAPVVVAPPPIAAPAVPVVVPAAPTAQLGAIAPMVPAAAPVPPPAPAPIPAGHLLRVPTMPPAATGPPAPAPHSGAAKPANVQLSAHPANRVDPRTVAMLEVGVALPGVAGLLLMTFGGGVIGYRQANASRYLRTGGAVRYLR